MHGRSRALESIFGKVGVLRLRSTIRECESSHFAQDDMVRIDGRRRPFPHERTLVPYPVHERPQLARPRRMPELAQRLGFDLAYAFAGYCEALPDFFQGML